MAESNYDRTSRWLSYNPSAARSTTTPTERSTGGTGSDSFSHTDSDGYGSSTGTDSITDSGFKITDAFTFLKPGVANGRKIRLNVGPAVAVAAPG